MHTVALYLEQWESVKHDRFIIRLDTKDFFTYQNGMEFDLQGKLCNMQRADGNKLCYDESTVFRIEF